MSRLLDTRHPRLLLTVFCLLLWTPGFFTLPPGDRDESRFAQASKQMIETGDLVRIQNGTEARNRKPIGIYWLQVPFAAAAQAAGIDGTNPIWPYRLPSLIGGWIAVLATFSLGKFLIGPREGLVGAAFLAASVVLSAEVHIAKTDAALLASIVLAMRVLARAYRDPAAVGRGGAAGFWLAMAASILLKGPVGPMVAGLATLVLAVAERRASWIRALHPGWGVPLMLLAVLPWFVAIGVATHGRFFAEAVGGDLGRKLSSGDDAHWGPPGLHLLLLPVLILPATAALPGALVQAWRERTVPATRFLLAWAGPSWLLFEAVPTKLPHYTLPLYPALCLLVSAWVLRPERRRVGGLGVVLAVLVAASLALALAALPVLLRIGPWIGLPAAVAGILLIAQFAQLSSRRREPPSGVAIQGMPDGSSSGPGLRRCARNSGSELRAFLGALACMPVLYWAALGWEFPRLEPLWIAPRVVTVAGQGPLGAVGFAEPSLMFLAGTDTEWLRPDQAVPAVRSGAVRTLVVGDRDLSTVLAQAQQAGLLLRRVGVVHGFNYSRGRFVDLTVLKPGPS